MPPYPADIAGQAGAGRWGIIDSHAHLCSPTRFEYRWGKREPHNLREANPAVFFEAVDGTSVDGLVFIEAAVVEGQIDDELFFAEEQAAADPRVLAYIAAVNFEAERSEDIRLARFATRPLVKGIRLLSRYAADQRFFLKEQPVRLIRSLAGLGLVCELGVWADDIGGVIQLARLCPDTQFILNHAGKPRVAEGLFQPWADDLMRLGACMNVACKVSGLPTLAGARLPTADTLGPYVTHVLKAFGPERVLFGSDWPMMEAAVDYAGWVEIVRQATPNHQEAVFRGNAVRLYHLPQNQG